MTPHTIQGWLTATAIVGALIPTTITALNAYHLHERMDTLAHFTAGASLAAIGLLATHSDLATVALVTATAFAWEWLEPRLPWELHTSSQDTEADIAVVALAACLVVLVA